ncbi:MAG: hypothetical protein DI537_13640 [Stutzerimonas stutzeri]|nr:MAG: hypothetical protein DI537_13640 [Stutzerimonas stutzeri]
MRYSAVAAILRKALYDTHIYARGPSVVVGRVATISTCEELYGGFMKYHGDAAAMRRPTTRPAKPSRSRST